MSTNGWGLVRNAEARRGAARPNTETPMPPTSAISASPSGTIRPYADARLNKKAAGSSSKLSSDTHATGRSSVRAHSASRVDLP